MLGSWKTVFFWNGLFSAAMLVVGRVCVLYFGRVEKMYCVFFLSGQARGKYLPRLKIDPRVPCSLELLVDFLHVTLFNA